MIYWDHNATTPLRPEVAELLGHSVQSAQAAPGNPASVHRAGREARVRLDGARTKLAAVLGCEPREVVFTGSGSEADALAVQGAFRARKDRARSRVVTSAIEHPAVLGSVDRLERDGAEVVRVAPDGSGRLDADELLAALTPRTALCSLMWANNETGVIQPVAEVARACAERGILFHTDAVQALGKVPVDLRGLPVGLFSASAHKLGGPAGAGVLVVRQGVEVEALVPGHHEGGRRGGTVNVAYAEAFALAVELAAREAADEGTRVAALRGRFEAEVQRCITGVRVNGYGALRLPNTSSLTFEGADGEALLIALDLEGICVSSGAACASGSLRPSHVLVGMGMSAAQAQASLRFSLGATSTGEEVERVVAALASHIGRARDAARG
ncbi:MAG: cysteine desulfurase [Myxococcales bacterium]|nr:cysteine desulfurase [Myxococcales bacterium]